MGARIVEELVARARLQDGILRGHFAAADCATAFAWAGRCTQVTRSLRESQLRLIERDRAARAPAPRRSSRPERPRPRKPPPRPIRHGDTKPKPEDLA
jgi:hypothetical protein